MRWPYVEEWVVGGLIALLAGLLIFAVWSEVSWSHYAAVHHCQKMGPTHEEIIWQYVYDGKGNLMMTYPLFVTEYLYSCDDNTQHWH